MKEMNSLVVIRALRGWWIRDHFFAGRYRPAKVKGRMKGVVMGLVVRDLYVGDLLPPSPTNTNAYRKSGGRFGLVENGGKRSPMQVSGCPSVSFS